MSAIAIAARNVSRSFGHHRVLDDVTLEVADGEFVSLVGPSGCGKTTLLRILGGFDQPSLGRVLLEGRDVTHAPPERRATNMVFQRGALFPHLTVAENIAYPLKRQAEPAREIARRVEEMLVLIRLPGFGTRRPAELSGGQAQRVALARALVGRPRVLLLDEPFSALDLALRKELQLELKRIHREFACAFVFVTHDQEEALVLSDRIAIMQAGRILQDGTPLNIYREPGDAFAARFIGEMNLVPGVLRARAEGTSSVSVGALALELNSDIALARPGEAVLLAIRPENVSLGPYREDGLNGTVEEVVYIGSRWRIKLSCPALSASVWAEVPASSEAARIVRGGGVGIALDLRHARLLRPQ